LQIDTDLLLIITCTADELHNYRGLQLRRNHWI